MPSQKKQFAMRNGIMYEPVRPGGRYTTLNTNYSNMKVTKPIVPDNEFDLRDLHPDDE